MRDPTAPGTSSLPLSRSIATRLEHEISNSKAVCLESIPALSRRYCVSRSTMLAAVRRLRTQGILRFNRGSRIEVAGRSPARFTMTASLGLAETIRSNIAEGSYKLGTELPKIAYFTATNRLSRDAVCEAFTILRAQSLIHKSGRAWVVGPSEAGSPKRLAHSSYRDSSRPTALILVPGYAFWNYYMRHFHARPFIHSVSDELHRCGIEYRVVLAEGYGVAPFIPSGRKTVLELIDELGSRFRGMLVMTNTHQSGWRRWAGWASPSGRNTVLFIDDPAGAQTVAREKAADRLVRCFHSESVTAAAAVKALHACGHRRIGFVHLPSMENLDWYIARYAGLEAACRSMVPAISLIPVEAGPLAWRDPREAVAMPAALPNLPVQPGLPPQDNAAASLTNALKPVIQRLHELTALIVINDRVAAQLLQGLTAAGIEIPKTLSLISFDNDPAFAPYPLATIDVGYTRMGYFAAHLLIGDIPVRLDRFGNLVCRPYLVDRGSLANRGDADADQSSGWPRQPPIHASPQ